MAYRAYVYVRENGRSPFIEYVNKIKNKREIAYIEAYIDKLISCQGQLPPPHAKKVVDKIWELRIILGNRIFYFIEDNQRIILLDGFTKKRNKIPPSMLRKVKNEYYDYMISQRKELFK